MLSFSIRRPIAILMLCIGLLVLGVISASRIPLQLMPPMDVPEFLLLTEYRGAGPVEVEQAVTTPVERQIATVPGLKGVESRSRRELSEIRVAFSSRVNILDTLSVLREKIDAAGLPDGAGKTRIVRSGASQEPLLRLAFQKREARMDMYEFSERLREGILRKVERVEGVALANFVSAPLREVEFLLNPAALEVFGLTLGGVSQTLQSANRSIAAGELVEDQRKVAIRVGKVLGDVHDYESVVLKRDRGREIRLKDIAKTTWRSIPPPIPARLQGTEALVVEVRRESDANAVDVSTRVRSLLEGTRGEWEEFGKLEVLLDEGTQIQAAISNVQDSVQQGIVLAAFCVYLLIQALWPTFIVTIIIPLSVLLTFIGMYFSGLSFNLMSLAGLALGVGMLVDNSMVVLESINEELLETSDTREAALRGSQKVMSAILGSTLAMIAVFGPLAFIEGEIGSVFREVALTLSFCLISSLFVSLTVIPVLCAFELRKDQFQNLFPSSSPGVGPLPPEPVPSRTMLGALLSRYLWAWRWLGFQIRNAGGASLRLFLQSLEPARTAFGNSKFLKDLRRVWTWLLTRVAGELMRSERAARVGIPTVIRAPKVAVGFTVGVTVLGLAMFQTLGSELFPENTSADLTYRLEFAPDQIQERTESSVKQIEQALLTSSAVRRVTTVVGVGGEHRARIFVQANAGWEGLARTTLERTLQHIPELSYSREPTSLIGTEKPLRVEFYHEDLAVLESVGREVFQELRQLKGTSDWETELKPRLTELEIRFNKPLLDFFELEPSQFLASLKSSLNGESGGVLVSGGTEAQLRLRVPANTFRSVQDLRSVSVTTQDRKTYLPDVSQVREVTSPGQVQHIDRRRVITLSASLDGLDLANAGQKISAILAKKWSAGSPVQWRIGGVEEKRKENQRHLLVAISLSIFLVFLILAAQFESLVQPWIVLVTVPLCLSGVGITLWIFQVPVSALVLVGFVILVGSSVNTSIVLVDFANQLRSRGKKPEEAILESSVKRLRPIIVTTATNLLGLFPMVWASGQGSEMQRPLALTLIGGLTSSTLLCFVIVPLLFERFESWKDRRAEQSG